MLAKGELELGSGRLIHSHCSPGLQYAALSLHLHHPTLHLASPWSPRAPGQSGEVVLGREAAALGKQLTYKQLTGHRAQWAEPTCPKQTLEQEASPAIHSLPRLEERKASKIHSSPSLPPQPPHLLVQPAPHHHRDIEVPPNGLVSLPKAVHFAAGLEDLGKADCSSGRD